MQSSTSKPQKSSTQGNLPVDKPNKVPGHSTPSQFRESFSPANTHPEHLQYTWLNICFKLDKATKAKFTPDDLKKLTGSQLGWYGDFLDVYIAKKDGNKLRMKALAYSLALDSILDRIRMYKLEHTNSKSESSETLGVPEVLKIHWFYMVHGSKVTITFVKLAEESHPAVNYSEDHEKDLLEHGALDSFFKIHKKILIWGFATRLDTKGNSGQKD